MIPFILYCVLGRGTIIIVVFGFFVIVIQGNTMAIAEAPLVIIIFVVAFGCSIRLAYGGDTAVIIFAKRKIDVVAFRIIRDIVFGIIIAVVVLVVVNCEGPTLLGRTLNFAIRIFLVGVDESKSPIVCDVRVLIFILKIIFIKVSYINYCIGL